MPEGTARRNGFSFRRDISVTMLGQAVVLVCGLLLYRLIALEKGAEGLASYALIKQLVVFVFPAVMLGLQTGIPRYIALDLERREEGDVYLLAAAAIIGTSTIAVTALALVSPDTTAAVMLGGEDRNELVVPLVATLVATVALEVTSGYLRGRLEFLVRTGILVVGVAAAPVFLLVAFPDESISTLITLMAAILLALCIVVIVPPLVRGARAGATRVRSAGRTLGNYGFRRIPGEFAAIALFTLAPVSAAHFAPLDEVAFLSAGLQLLAVVAIAFHAVGLVFLPVLSHLCATDFPTAARYVSLLAACALHIAVFATPQLLLFGDTAAIAWLGPDFNDAGPIIRITMAPVAFFVFYLILHISLDAAEVRSYNSRNRVLALAAAALVAAVSLGLDLGDELEAITWSFAVGVACLGAFTLLSVNSVFGLGRSDYALRWSLLLAAAAGALGAALRFLVVGDDHSLAMLLVVAGAQLVLAVGFLAGLVRAGVPWPLELRARLRSRTA